MSLETLPKTLPHSDESERAVLAAAFLDPVLFEEATGELDPDDFYSERHRLIFRTDHDLLGDGHTPDILTMQAKLEQQDKLDAVGGVAYLASLDLDLPDLDRLGTYVGIIRDRSTRRRVVELCEKTRRRALDGGGVQDAPALVDSLWRDVEALERPLASGELWASELLPDVLADAEGRRRQKLDTGNPVLGLETGIRGLDDLLAGLNQGLYLLAGPPGVGKTSLALQMAFHVAEHSAVPVIYLSFENSARNLLLKTLCGRAALNPLSVNRGFLDLEPLRKAAEKLRPALGRLALLDGNGRWSVGQLRAWARRALKEHDAEQCLVVVDYLQLFAKMNEALRKDKGLDVRGRVDVLAGELTELSKRLNSPVLALSSLSRMGYGSGKPKPDLDSLKESGDLEYSADVALFLAEDAAEQAKTDPPARALTLYIKKNRHGPTGTVNLIFRPDRGTLLDKSYPRDIAAHELV